MRNVEVQEAGDLLALLFPSDLDDEAVRAALIGALKERNEPAGTTFVRQGETSELLWFLPEGSVAIHRDWSGTTLHVATLTAPAIFGATTFFRPAASAVTISAASDCRVMTLDHAGYERLRREHPRAAELLALATLRVLSERFDLLDRRVTEFLSRPAGEPIKVNEWNRFRRRLFEDPSII